MLRNNQIKGPKNALFLGRAHSDENHEDFSIQITAEHQSYGFRFLTPLMQPVTESRVRSGCIVVFMGCI